MMIAVFAALLVILVQHSLVSTPISQIKHRFDDLLG
jgi:hypothetical protein